MSNLLSQHSRNEKVKVEKFLKFICSSFPLAFGLAACEKSGPPDVKAHPDEYLQYLASTSATVLGTKDGEKLPTYQVSFSNGYMESGAVGKAPVNSGEISKGGSPNATCIGFAYESVGKAQDFLCVTVRDFDAYDSVAVKNTALVKGDLFITQQVEAGSFGRGFTEIYRGQVK